MGAVSATENLSSEKPPLSLDVRLRLSVMMFLQFAVWGSWFVVLGPYLNSLGFTGDQIGTIYGTMALGAILSTMFAGQLADRYFASEKLMAVLHIVGAGLLFLMSQIDRTTKLASLAGVAVDLKVGSVTLLNIDFGGPSGLFFLAALGYALVYNPTLSVSNSLAFANVPDATRDFPSLRVLGTIGWIAANLAVDFVLPSGAATTNQPLIMAAVLSAVLGVMCFALPHTPPTGRASDSLPFLRAFGLLGDFSFGVFFIISFVITIALAFYYGFTGVFLDAVGTKNVATTMSFGQMSEIGFMLLLPVFLYRLGMKWVLAIGMAAWGVRYGCFSVAAGGEPYALILLGVILHGVCFDFFLAAGFIHTDNKAPRDIRGSAQALFSFLTYGVGMFIGNIVSGIVMESNTVRNAVGEIVSRDWSTIWMVPAVGVVVCLALFVLLWKDTAGKAEEAPSAYPVGTAADKSVSEAQPAPSSSVVG